MKQAPSINYARLCFMKQYSINLIIIPINKATLSYENSYTDYIHSHYI
jgi:hypothetical protein